MGIWVHHFVSNPPVLTFGRATREDYDVGSSRSQAVPLGDRCGEQGSLSAHFGVFSSKQQADVVCKAKLCGTCSTDFVRGSVKRQARHRMIKQRQKMCSRHCPKKKQYLCRLPLALVILQLFFCTWVTATKNTLRPRCLSRESALPFWRACCRWQQYLQYGQFCVASTLLWCGESQFPVCVARLRAIDDGM